MSDQWRRVVVTEYAVAASASHTVPFIAYTNGYTNTNHQNHHDVTDLIGVV
jgi:hypothetical protein